MRLLHTLGLSALLAIGVTTSASANVMMVTSQAAFSASGMIAQNTNWDSYGPGFFFPGSPFTVGDLTFVAGGRNVIGGVGTFYNLSRDLLTDDFVRGTTIQIAGNYNMVAFNAGNFFTTGSVRFAVKTNIGNHIIFETVSDAANMGPLTFVGFETDFGEHITAINVTGAAPGVTDIQIGTRVPEPLSLALFGAGLAGLGAARRRRKSA